MESRARRANRGNDLGIIEGGQDVICGICKFCGVVQNCLLALTRARVLVRWVRQEHESPHWSEIAAATVRSKYRHNGAASFSRALSSPWFPFLCFCARERSGKKGRAGGKARHPFASRYRELLRRPTSNFSLPKVSPSPR